MKRPLHMRKANFDYWVGVYEKAAKEKTNEGLLISVVALLAENTEEKVNPIDFVKLQCFTLELDRRLIDSKFITSPILYDGISDII